MPIETRFRTNPKGDIEPVIKSKRDRRVTRIGKYIRKYSMDELPQLLNVLKGEMSLVGPRPPVIKEAHMYNPYQKIRLRCKPGLTGLAQINGRTDMDFDSILRFDILFIKKRSIRLYFKILALTVPCILRGKSSY
jgi:lipopolysaccharide/colanic/teichoic acid biosynthesis glycosyltransferase